MIEYELSNGICEYSNALKFIKKPFTLAALNNLTAIKFERMLLLDHKETQRLRDLNEKMRSNSSFCNHMLKKDPSFSLDDPQAVRCALAKCSGCGSIESSLHTFLLCSACERVKYCSKTCQRSDWAIHKSFCLCNRK